MASHDDDPAKPKPLFVPPAPGTKPSSGGSPIFAPPSFPKPGAKPGPVAPTIVPAKAPPSASSSSPSLAKPALFGEWPTELEAAPAPAPASVEPPAPTRETDAEVEAEVEASRVELDRPNEALPDEPTAPIELAAPLPSASSSAPRAPVHARKTSTQAHSIVGEFGVPLPPSGSRPSTPIVEGRVRSQRDEDEESTESRDDLVPRRPAPDYDDTEETDEEPKPLPATAVSRAPASESKPGVGVPLMIGLGLVAVLAVAWVFGDRDRGEEVAKSPPKPNVNEPSKSVEAPAPAPEPESLPDTPREPIEPQPATTSSTTSTSGTSETDEGVEEPEPPPRSDVDPRDRSVIPAGTSEAAIKAFTKLPVSVHDGPPLGGIGETGIHIDAISTGADVRNGTCLDEAASFSIATTKEVSVCFRVVHDRAEETVRVLWDKDGATVRRGNVRIRDLHAYKTRAYLELRGEYVGKWRVRIQSEDNVELAAHAFELVP
jgi:hypothetical protein